MALTDLVSLDSGDFDLGYNDPGLVATEGASTSGFSYADIKGYIGDAVQLYGAVRSVTTSQGGSSVAQPVTIPAPQSPIGRDASLNGPPAPGFFQGLADKFKISLNMVYILAGTVAVAVVFFGYKIFKGR